MVLRVAWLNLGKSNKYAFWSKDYFFVVVETAMWVVGVSTMEPFSWLHLQHEFDEVAEALILRHPCLRENTSPLGYEGWKMSLKYKLSNYRTQLRKVGCPEVCVNSLRNKPAEKRSSAFNMKKPKRGEVECCPPFPLGKCGFSTSINLFICPTLWFCLKCFGTCSHIAKMITVLRDYTTIVESWNFMIF